MPDESNILIKKLLRFGFSGGIGTLLYGLLAISMSYLSQLDAMAVHVLAYALCVPVSYLLQRNFTFRYEGQHRVAILKFITAAVLAFCVSTLLVQLIKDSGYPEYLGTLIVMVIVPVSSYLTMQLWVFTETR